MNMYQKIIVLVGIILIIGIVIQKKSPAHEWRDFSDENIGIEFQYPKTLKPFPPQEMYFRECEECSGLIYVKSEDFGSFPPEKVMERSANAHQKIIGETEIDGLHAIVTTFTNTDGSNGQKTAYVVKNGRLFTIMASTIDFEHLWRSIKLIQN